MPVKSARPRPKTATAVATYKKSVDLPFAYLVAGEAYRKVGKFGGLNQTCSAYAIPYSYPSMATRFENNKNGKLFDDKKDDPYICIFKASSIRPLDIWDKQVRSGAIKRVLDPEQDNLVLEIGGKSNLTFIISPICPTHTLGIRLPIFVLEVKKANIFEFQVELLDDTNVRRLFKFSTSVVYPKVFPFSCVVPCKMVTGWNQIVLNLQEISRKVFNTEYKEAVRVQVHANCRLRRIYFCESAEGNWKLDGSKTKSKRNKVNNYCELPASHSGIQSATIAKHLHTQFPLQPLGPALYSVESATVFKEELSTDMASQFQFQYNESDSELGSQSAIRSSSFLTGSHTRSCPGSE